MSLNLTLYDASFPCWDSDSAAYGPTIHRFTHSQTNQTIKLIDVVESWKGLNPSQAHELCLWHNALRDAMQRHVQDILLGNLSASQVKDDAMEVHRYVSSLYHQIVTLDIDAIIDDTVKHVGPSRREWPWLGKCSKRVALVNLLRLQSCFMTDEPNIRLYFYSELKAEGAVQVYAEVMGSPQVFGVDQQNGCFTFQAPMLDPGKGFYDVRVGEVTRDVKSDALCLTVSTIFKDTRFERLFRFRNEIQNNQMPSPRPVPTKYPKQPSSTKKKRIARKQLREISQTSIRVQGTSDFERAARDNHPALYRVHHDHSIGKSTNLGTLSKIFGARELPPVVSTANMVTMQHDYNHIRPHLGGANFTPPLRSQEVRMRRVVDEDGVEWSCDEGDEDDDAEPFLSEQLPDLPSPYVSDEDNLYEFSPVKVRGGVLSSPERAAPGNVSNYMCRFGPYAKTTRDNDDITQKISGRAHDAYQMFASSPDRELLSPCPVSPSKRTETDRATFPRNFKPTSRRTRACNKPPNRRLLRPTTPMIPISPMRLAKGSSGPRTGDSISTAVWRGSDPSWSVSAGSEDDEEAPWNPRKMVENLKGMRKGKAKEKEEASCCEEMVMEGSLKSVTTVEISPPQSLVVED